MRFRFSLNFFRVLADFSENMAKSRKLRGASRQAAIGSDERRSRWAKWRMHFRSLWDDGPKLATLEEVFAKALGFKGARSVRELYGTGRNTKRHLKILSSIATLAEGIEREAAILGIPLSAGGVEKLKSELVPELATLCRAVAGVSANSEYRLLGNHFDDVRIWEEMWSKASTVVLVNIFGGRFRNRRLEWKNQGKHKRIPRPTSVGDETTEQMNDRIKREVAADEPWGPQLVKLTVFIASAKMFSRWLRADGGGQYESPEATRKFWKAYLNKLLNASGAQRMAGAPKRKRLFVELYECDHLDFVCHGVNWDRPGALIVGSHLCCGAPAPLGFQVEWPTGTDTPPHYDVFKTAIENLKYDARAIPLDP